MEKYKELIDKINEEVEKFNSFILPDYHITQIDGSALDNKNHFTKLKQETWDNERWPNAIDRGVYFIFGKNTTNESDLGVYIGKASFSSTIGKRLWSHLHPSKNSDDYIMSDSNGTKYIMEMLTNIPLEEKKISFLASALEEYLITELNQKIIMLNVSGVTHK